MIRPIGPLNVPVGAVATIAHEFGYVVVVSVQLAGVEKLSHQIEVVGGPGFTVI